MHLYVIGRGIKPHLERWENDLLAQPIPYKFKDKDGKLQDGAVQLSVRPIKLYEIVFPEDQLDLVMSMVGTSDAVLKENPRINKFVKVLRKFMRLQKAPKVKTSIWFAPNNISKAVGITPIGLKKDEFRDGVERL